jgi:cobalt/nickel transport system permease protein
MDVMAMHIAEGFLPPIQALIWTVIAVPFVVYGAMQTVKIARAHPEAKLLLAASGAFIFVMSAIKLPSVTGSSSHPTGTGVGAILFRPPVIAFLGTIVLIFQALLLAHGGLTTLGANVMSMAVIGPWAGYTVYVLLRPLPFAVAAFAGIAVANLATYVVTATQLAIAFPDEDGGFLSAWERFLGLFAVTQIPLAIIEGIIGVILLRVLVSWTTPTLRAIGFDVERAEKASASKAEV